MAAPTVIFPAGINLTRNFMTITSMTLEQKSNIEEAKSVQDATSEQVAKEIFCQIMLPLPNSLQDNTAHNWEVAEGLTQEAGQVLGSASEGFANKLFGSAGGAANSAVLKLARKAGFNMDPKYWQMYNGTMPRSFSFDWTLIPESRIDAQNMVTMLKLLKMAAAPGDRGATSLLLDTPNIFTIKFENPILHNTVRLKDVVCVGINIDYMGQGYSDFYEDGHPKQVKLSMSFNERHTLYKQDYEGDVMSSSSYNSDKKKG